MWPWFPGTDAICWQPGLPKPHRNHCISGRIHNHLRQWQRPGKNPEHFHEARSGFLQRRIQNGWNRQTWSTSPAHGRVRISHKLLPDRQPHPFHGDASPYPLVLAFLSSLALAVPPLFQSRRDDHQAAPDTKESSSPSKENPAHCSVLPWLSLDIHTQWSARRHGQRSSAPSTSLNGGLWFPLQPLPGYHQALQIHKQTRRLLLQNGRISFFRKGERIRFRQTSI